MPWKKPAKTIVASLILLAGVWLGFRFGAGTHVDVPPEVQDAVATAEQSAPSSKHSGFPFRRSEAPPTKPDYAPSLATKPPLSAYHPVVRFLATQKRLRSKKPMPEDIPNLHPSVVDAAGRTNQSRLAEFIELHERRHLHQEAVNAKVEKALENLRDEYGLTENEKLAIMRSLDREMDSNPVDAQIKALDKRYADQDGTLPPGAMPASRASDFLISLLKLDPTDSVVYGASHMGKLVSAQSMYLADPGPENAIRLLKGQFGPDLTDSQIELLLTVPLDKLFTPITREEYMAKRDEIMRRTSSR